jgi:hypothetical protein
MAAGASYDNLQMAVVPIRRMEGAVSRDSNPKAPMEAE